MIRKSEPHCQHENFSERRYHIVKHLTNNIIDCTSAPVYTWPLSLIYVWFLLNRTHANGINSTPINKATRYTPVISIFLYLRFVNPYIKR